jgi:hypothetical protein
MELLMLALGSMAAGWANTFIHAVLTSIWRLLVDEREYAEENCKLGVQAAMKRICDLHWFAEKHDVVHNRMLPAGLVIGPWFCAHVSTKSNDGSRGGHGRRCGASLVVTIMRLRWHGPLVPDGDVLDVKDPPEGTILVLRHTGDDGWSVRRELACPGAVPRVAAENARETAKQIVDAMRCGTQQMRVILSGRPATGKTMTARLVAQALGGTLVPGFDPSKPGCSTCSVLSTLSTDSTIVLSMDEFDECLRRTAVPSQQPSSLSQKNIPEVTDRASWNAMLDMLQFTPNVVVVMSTNMSFAQLDEEFDASVLRVGRVTHRMTV